MIQSFILCLLGIAYVQAATVPPSIVPGGVTTHKHHHGHHTHVHHNGTHPTREPSEHENFRFVYEPIIHNMIMANGMNCYIVPLSDAERTAVHTDTGIRALELKLLGLLSGGTLTNLDKATLDKKTLHACGHVKGEYYSMA